MSDTPAWAVDQGTVRGGNVATDAAMAADAGFRALGLALDQLLQLGVERAHATLTDAGLAVSGIQGLPDLNVDPDETHGRYVAALDAAAALDASGCLVGTGPIRDRTIEAADGIVRDRLARLVDRIGIVQLTDVPWSALDGLRYERDRFDTGDVPVARLRRAFHEAGYRGSYECEILLRMPREERPQFLRDTHAWLVANCGTLRARASGWTGGL